MGVEIALPLRFLTTIGVVVVKNRETVNRTLLSLTIIAVVVSLGGVSDDAEAGGIILYELGAPEVGRAAAGWAARADDAATLFTNPAGMARLPRQQLLVGGQAIYGNFTFEQNANTTVSGNNGGNGVGWLPGASVFYTRELGSGWNAGIGAFSYFGLAAEYDAGWVGRYYVQKSALVGLTLMPAISYRANEQLSFGAGFNWMFGFFNQESKVKNFVPNADDGNVKIDDHTQGFGANVGALWEATDEFRIGVTYLSPVRLDFRDTPEFTGLGPLQEAALRRAGLLGAPIDLGLEVPQTVMVSGYRQLSAELAVMGNVGWQNWNRFGKAEVSVADTLLSATVDLGYKDTWHVAVGADWHVATAWLVTAGIAYDSSPVSDHDRALQLPMGETLRLGVGGQWDWTESLKMGFAYELGWMGNLKVDQLRQIGNQIINRVAGQYTNAALHVFAVNLVWDI
jgi:long-chain fatty acid transport protein